MRVGQSAKGRSGRQLVVYATQILCSFFLFHLLYTELTFKATQSQQIKLDIVVSAAGRQILLDSKPPSTVVTNSTVVKKDAAVITSQVKKLQVQSSSTVLNKDHNHNHNDQSTEYLLTRLLGGEDRRKLESTGFACDNTSWSIVCITNKPVKINMNTMQVHLHPSLPNTTTIIRPYSMQENPYAMNYITPVTITTVEPPRPSYYLRPPPPAPRRHLLHRWIHRKPFPRVQRKPHPSLHHHSPFQIPRTLRHCRLQTFVY
ncbi:hypothetical protein QVD17_27162 [Tagetes erecta]|uniref:Uncharacterized protein n=1 Tax=Tagetes erecta TaxID=13708 RepID=A0AAD8K7Y0_TARER|nr:hypothetical protein QVD17_27162 [Tagetes erecta]